MKERKEKDSEGKKGLKFPMGTEHWQRDAQETEVADLKYTTPEMGNPEHLKKNVDALAEYCRKNKAQH